MCSIQVAMNEEIDSLIAGLQLAKSIPGYDTKVAAVDRVLSQVEGFVAYWDYQFSKPEHEITGER